MTEHYNLCVLDTSQCRLGVPERYREGSIRCLCAPSTPSPLLLSYHNTHTHTHHCILLWPQAGDIDTLISVHDKYVNTIFDRCLLNKKVPHPHYLSHTHTTITVSYYGSLLYLTEGIVHQRSHYEDIEPRAALQTEVGERAGEV